MQTNFAKFFLMSSAAAWLFCSCSGGEKAPSEAFKPKQVSPGHLVMEGRSNSEIIIQGVCYPRTDGTPSIAGEMVITIPPVPLPNGPLNASYVKNADNALPVTLPPYHEGEIPHAVDLAASYTETPDSRSEMEGPWGSNTVGYIQLVMQDIANGIHYQCDTVPINLRVISSVYEPQGDPVWEDFSGGDPSSSAGRWRQEYHITYTGVVESGIIHVQSINAPAGHLKSFEGDIELQGCQFTWTCDESRVEAANNPNNNPSDPIPPFF